RNTGQVLRPSTMTALLASTRTDAETAGVVRPLQETNALGATKLVCRAETPISLTQAPGRKFSQPLGRVADEGHAFLTAHLRKFRPGLEHAGLVVRRHHDDGTHSPRPSVTY